MKRLSPWILSTLLIGCTPAPPASTATPAASPVAANSPVAATTPEVEATPIAPPVTSKTGLKYEVFKKGEGAVAEKGKKVFVHYTGRLTDGTKFDSSLDRGVPIDFPLGGGRVIPGWEEGIEGMKVGEKRKLTIPSDLAYGDRGSPPVIPPKATLIFDVELVDVQ